MVLGQETMHLKSPTLIVRYGRALPWRTKALIYSSLDSPHTHPSLCTVLHNWKYSLKCWFKRNELIGLDYFIWRPSDLQTTVECISLGNSDHLYNVSAPPCDYPAANLTMRKWRHIFFICFHFLSSLGESRCLGIITLPCKEKPHWNQCLHFLRQGPLYCDLNDMFLLTRFILFVGEVNALRLSRHYVYNAAYIMAGELQ